jgi:hypothetical protein
MRKFEYSLFIFTIIYFLTSLQGCVSLPSDVIMPQWDTDLNIPITTKNYLLNDIIKSQNYISINKLDNTYWISIDSLNQNVTISDFIQINSEQSTPTEPVPADNKTTIETYLQFPDGAKLSKASLSRGKFKLIAHNFFPTDAQLTISIPGITKSGAPLPITLTVPANTPSKTLLIDLKDCDYSQPANQNPSKDGQLWIKASATSVTGLSYVTFESYTSDFSFISATGYLPTKSLGIHNSSFPLNLGNVSDYRDKIVLKNGSLFLYGQYKSKDKNPFVVGVNNLKLVGKRTNSQQTDTLKFNDGNSNSFQFDASGIYTTEYNESNSNITSFITFLPDSIFVSAEYIMNPDNNRSYKTVRMDDTISFTTKFLAKSILSVSQTTFIDTISIDISKDDRNKIQNSKGLQLNCDLLNAIPLNAWIKVTLVDNNYHPLLINGSPFVITKNNNGMDSINIQGAQTDFSGNVSNPTVSKTSIILNSAEINQFSNNAHYAILSATVQTSNNNLPVIVHATDWIKLNLYGKVTYTINKSN